MAYGILSALPMLVCLFWTVALLLEAGRGGRAKRTLAVFMGVAAVLYFCHSVFFNRVYSILAVTDTLYSLCTLSVYPLYLLYIKALSERAKPTVRDLWIFVPAIVSFVACAVIYAMMESGEMAAYLGQVVYGHIEAAEVSSLAVAQSVRARLAGIVTAIQIIYVLPQGIRKIARYNREINNYYSDTEGKTYSDIRTLLVFFVATSLTSFVASIIGKEYFADSVWLILIPSLLFSTLLYALGYIGNRHNFTIEDLEKDELNTDRQESLSPENPALAQEYRQRREIIRREVLRLLEYEELFRNPTLRITDVAARLGSNRAYISRMINQDLNTSFSDLVNSYRIEYAKKLLQEPRRSPMFLSDVYERSGFSSESSFYRIFKKGTGLSPKAWHDRYSATGGM